jgi:hypothetical protein
VSEPASPEPSPFKRFEDFARRIVAVPKSELDEKQAEYDKKKADRKTRSA